jgi:hypothetical protein
MYKFKQLIGRTIGVLLVGEQKTLDLTIRGVEDGGIWVESPDLNKMVRKTATLDTVGLKPIVFFPYARIRFAWYSVASPDAKVRVA